MHLFCEPNRYGADDKRAWRSPRPYGEQGRPCRKDEPVTHRNVRGRQGSWRKFKAASVLNGGIQFFPMTQLPTTSNTGRSGLTVVVLRLGSHPLSAELTADLTKLRLHHPDTRIVVAENADARPYVETTDTVADKTIRFESNLGYAVAVNRAAACRASPRVVMVLTDDVVVRDGSLGELVDLLDATGAAIVAPINQTGDQMRVGGTWHPRWGWARHRLLTRRTEGELTDVDWVDGACLAIDGAFLESVAGFDERTFLYMEDCLICRQAARRNRRVVVATGVVVRQASGMRQRSGAHGYLLIRNEVLAMQQTTRWWYGVLLSGLLRTGFELTRSIGVSDDARHHRRQAAGMALGLYHGAIRRFGPPPERLADWAQIPNIDRSAPRPTESLLELGGESDQ